MPTWSKHWDILPPAMQKMYKDFLRDTSKTAISDLELSAARWMLDNNLVAGEDFVWQYRAGRMRVDLVLLPRVDGFARAIELQGCGYHQCPKCFPKPWFPDRLEKDAARRKRLRVEHQLHVEVIWNHEDIDERMADLFTAPYDPFTTDIIATMCEVLDLPIELVR